ncbi:hypothetical protein ACNJX9_39030 [Bradyrhizobium sp. DASA03076]|uniref:hypothetical protein n=1 Tax=Bradyrhizobium sp. BLXBL-03 TaxID=3395916 RepID=UPI003F6E9FBB
MLGAGALGGHFGGMLLQAGADATFSRAAGACSPVESRWASYQNAGWWRTSHPDQNRPARSARWCL